MASLHQAVEHCDVKKVEELLSSEEYQINCTDSEGRTPLHIACGKGYLALVRVLVGYGADFTARDNYKYTPLTLAAKNFKYDCVLSIINEFDCSVNTRGAFGYTLLHYACAFGGIDLVHVLAQDCRADLKIKDRNGMTPLMLAVHSNHYEVVKALVCEYGCDPNVKMNSGRTLLHIACADGDIDLVHVLVRERKADLNINNVSGEKPIVTAAKNNQCEVVKALVCEYGCDPNVINQYVSTRLLDACYKGDIDSVHVFVRDCKADLKIKDHNGMTPLMIAVHSNHYEVVKALVCDYGCDPNVKMNNGRTLLHIACADGDIDLVHVLVRERKADLNINNVSGEKPIVTAAKNNQCEVVKALVCEYGCDPNVINQYVSTRLLDACYKGDIDSVHVFARDCKADLKIKDRNGRTPLMIAVHRNHFEVVKALVCDYGCEPNVKMNSGRTLLHIACADGDIDLVHVLVRDCKADLNTENVHGDKPIMTAAKKNQSKVVKSLISEYKCDVSITDSNGRSLLHMAGGVEVLNLLLVEYQMSPLLADNDGNTPLHLYSSGQTPSYVDMVFALLFKYNVPIYILNKEGKPPRDLVINDQIRSVFKKYLAEHGEEIQVVYKSMQLLAAKRYSGSNLICRLFVVGHPGAGKSSLVETLKREGFFESFSRVSVLPHTAGIIPSLYISDSYGRVQFYDFAGSPEYYSSHAAILERLFQSNIGTNICIIVLNLLEDDVEIEEKYLFWLSFINYSFKRLEESPSVVVIGSHSDQLFNKKEVNRKKSFIQDLISNKYKNRRECVSLSLNCCSPRSSNIRLLRQTIHDISKKSQPYSLSLEESILLGLLEKDFSNVTACTAQTIASHIEELNLSLPRSVSLLYPILQQLQAIGVLLLVGKEQDCYIVLNVAQLTNEVHKRLFSQDAFYINPSLASFNIGLLPQPLLREILSNYITKECLIQLQYCQEVAHIEIGSDHSVSPSLICPGIITLHDKSYLFFPALCRLDKKDISWQTPPEHSYSIGWLARCHDPHDYFPPRFLHVFLLRIALRFTLVAYDKASPDHQQLKRRCEMWKTGVHWLSEEGVECEVDVIGSKEVAVSLRSAEESKMCLSVLNSIVSCVMEAKAEFCDFIVLDFFLLDKVSCLTDDNLFHAEDVERVLREGKPNVVSMSGKKFLSTSKLVHISSSFWSCLFPIDEHSVLKYIDTIVVEWLHLGLFLELSPPVLKAIETNYARDVLRCKTEMVITWLNSSLPHPPCWWSLVKALRETEKIAYRHCANRITEDKGEHIALQEKLLNSQDSHLTPDEEFLESFAGVVGCKWPYLASLLSLTSSTIEDVRREGKGLTQRERALLMLHKWVSLSKDEATYSQLYHKIKPVSLIQYCKN